MKRKILIIALALVLAMTVSALIGCTLKVTAIELVKGSLATEYYVGETVDMSQAKIKATYNDGTEKTVTLTESMLDAPISTAQAGKKTYTITYEGKTYAFDVEVKLPTLSIKAGSFNTSYYVGDEVSYNGAKIVVKNGDAAGVDVALTADMVSPAISTAKAGTTTHTITYNGATTTFDVTVSVPQISLVNGSLKLEYLVGETVDLSNAKISVKCGTRPAVEVGFNKVTLDKEITTTATGKTTYTVSYNGATTTFEVTVRQVKEITSVNLDSEYIKDEQVSLDGVKMNIKYTDDTTGEVALTWDMIYAIVDGQVAAAHATSIDTSLGENVAEKTVKYVVKYGGQSKDVEITVKDIPVKSIAVSPNFVTDYFIGYNTPVFTGTHLAVTLDNEAETVRNIALINAEFSPALPEQFTEGTYTFTLSYRGKTTSLTINVYDIELQIVDGFKKSYNVGDDIIVDGKLVGSKIKVVAKDANNTVKEDNVDVTEAMVKTLFSTEAAGGDKTLVIEYKGKTLTIDDIVVNPVTISLATGSDALKTVYNPNEQVSLNGKIVVTYTDHTSKTVDITNDMLAHPISTEHSGRFANTITYLGESVDFEVIVKVLGRVEAFNDNSAYTNIYKIQKDDAKSVTAEDYTAEYDGVLSDGSFVYEVGNVNKFKFEPLAAGYDENGDEETFTKPFVNMQLYIKETLDGQYRLLTDEEAAQYVTVTDNVYYAFANEAVTRYFKLVLTLDEEVYEEIDAKAKNMVEIEFKVVDGYNVYDALGLSAFDNLNKKNWQELKQAKLECDDKTLYEYNDQIKLVVLHNNINIDPMLLPLNYFWDKTQDYQKEAFSLTQQNMRDDGFGDVVDSLNGTLRDGEDKDGKSYKHGANQNTICVNGIYEEDFAWVLNMQKGLYNSSICDVSGNGMQISVPQYNKNAARNLIEVYGTDAKGEYQHAIPHWALFRMYDDTQTHSFNLYNLRLDGNTPRSEVTIATAGINMVNAYAKDVTLTNVSATGFYADITLEVETGMNLNSAKLVDSYNSMFYLWRSHANVTNSVLRKSGGPLILMDAGSSLNESDGIGVGGEKDDIGCVITVDTASILECYASGEENWYKMYNSSAILSAIKSFNGLTQGYLGKNVITKTDGGIEMLNMIAAMIITPDDLMDNHPQGEEVAFGRFDKVDANGNVVQSYAMHDPIVQGIQSVARTAIFSSEGNYAYLSQDNNAITPENDQGLILANPTTKGAGDWISDWQTCSCDTMCVYMHAGLPSETDPNAPQVKAYFGIILGLNNSTSSGN